MHFLKKYTAIAFLLSVFPMVQFFANKLILESDDEIYAFIPQESDFVIEINTRNFISEIAYQRIFEENYFLQGIYPTEGDQPTKEKLVDIGLDVFSKIILFREQWAGETIWLAVMKSSDEEKVKRFVNSQFPDARFEFGGDYLIAQLSPSQNQVNLDEHLKKISNKEVKGFQERVNLNEVFDPNKEINCFIIPKNSDYNQLIDGYLSFDFKEDHIEVGGAFTPVPEFSGTAPVAYGINPHKAFSLRSSLNLFNSVYLFSDNKLENIPEYTQLAFDYNGVECRMTNAKTFSNLPYLFLPDANIHFDILNENVWTNFVDSLMYNNQIAIDTLHKSLQLPLGAKFNYEKTNHTFRMMQEPFELTPSTDKNLYFDFKLITDDFINGTQFTVDEKNPPGALVLNMSQMITNQMFTQIRSIDNIEWIAFQLTGDNTAHVNANGRLEMKEKEGHSIIECFSFGATTLSFIKDYVGL